MHYTFYSGRYCWCTLVLAYVLLAFSTDASAQNSIGQNASEQHDTLKAAVVSAAAKPSPTVQSAPLQVMEKDDFLNEMRVSFQHKFAKKPEVIDGNMMALELAFEEVCSLLFADGNPAGVKALLAHQSKMQHNLRLPLAPARKEVDEAMHAAMTKLDAYLAAE